MEDGAGVVLELALVGLLDAVDGVEVVDGVEEVDEVDFDVEVEEVLEATAEAAEAVVVVAPQFPDKLRQTPNLFSSGSTTLLIPRESLS